MKERAPGAQSPWRWPGGTVRAPWQPVLWPCLASCPRLGPTPHQVQCRAAAQVLHDDPQLRALGPEKGLSACGSQHRAPQAAGRTPQRGSKRSGPSGGGLQQPHPLLPTPLLQQLCRRPRATVRSANPPPPPKPGWENGLPSRHAPRHTAHQEPLGRPPRASTGLRALAWGSQSAPSRASRMRGGYPSPSKTWHSQAVGSRGRFRAPDPGGLFSPRRPQASPEGGTRNLQQAAWALGLLFSGGRSLEKLCLCSC